MTQKVINRITTKIQIPNQIELLVDRLSFGELQSLLVIISELKTRKKNCNNILKEYQYNTFV